MSDDDPIVGIEREWLIRAIDAGLAEALELLRELEGGKECLICAD